MKTQQKRDISEKIIAAGVAQFLNLLKSLYKNIQNIQVANPKTQGQHLQQNYVTKYAYEPQHIYIRPSWYYYTYMGETNRYKRGTDLRVREPQNS